MKAKPSYHLLSPLDRAKEEIYQWGNHMKKFRTFIDRYYLQLTSCLESFNLRDEVHLKYNLPDIDKQVERDMEIISSLDVEKTETVNYLGVYYALKIVQLNINGIDYLRAQVRLRDPKEVYETFMRELGWRFRAVTKIFLENLVNIYSKELNHPDFLLASVGTRADQDDIDVIVITDSVETGQLDRLMSRVNTTMTKFALPLHFHIAENISDNKYSTTCEELKDYVLKNISNFVVITEILGAKRILGSKDLMRKFDEDVLLLFYPEFTVDSRYHEAYLRIILGETGVYLSRSLNEDFIHPKNDALRMIKGLIAILKTRYNIRYKNAWTIIDILKKEDIKHWDIYAVLRESLAFFETVRFLYMLYGVQDERISLKTSESREILEKIGNIMGINSYGGISAIDHLLMKYYEHLHKVRKIVEILVNDIRDYLSRITVFKEVLVTDRENIALDFAKQSAFFKGSRFWEDILEMFTEKDNILLKEFVKSYLNLPERKRKRILNNLFYWLEISFEGLLQFIIYLNELGTDNAVAVKGEFINTFFLYLNKIESSPSMLLRFFNLHAVLLNKILISLNKNHLMFLIENIIPQFDNISSEYNQTVYLKSNLKNIIEVYGYGSRYFRKYFQRITEEDPDLIHSLGSYEQIEDVCAGLFADVSRTSDRTLQKKLLGHFYDLEFIHTGLRAIRGESYEDIAGTFISFTESYIRSLFGICKLEIESQRRKIIIAEDIFSLFTVGSTARGSVYNDDLDLLILLDSNDSDLFVLYNKIISKMNREIVKRGIIPQYRFADHFGNYVTKLEELQGLFKIQYDGDYVELSQLLEAKPIISSIRIRKIFTERLLNPYVYEKWKVYAKNMIREIKCRHGEFADKNFNIKEAPGAIKDIEMMLLIFKAKYKLKCNSSIELIENLLLIDKKNKDQWQELNIYLREFKELRQLTRLTLSMDNEINLVELRNTIPSFYYFESNDDKKISEKYIQSLKKSKNLINYLIIQIMDSF